MRMRVYRRRKIACRIMRRVASIIMWIGVLLAMGTAGRIGLGMSEIQGMKMMLIEMAVMAAAWTAYCLSRYLERHIITFSDSREKRTKI